MSADPSEIATCLAAYGLILRGGFDFDDSEDRPAGPSGQPAKAVLLVGNAGAAYWAHFSRWRAAQPPDLANPLDTWSRTILEAIAETVGARVLMPNDRPFAPFQQWAMRAEGLRASPLGILMHPRFGLWHAFRGALLLDAEISIHVLHELNQVARDPIHLCDLCAGKPCLNACPAAAFDGERFACEACVAHVRGPAGAACRQRGCLARNACPQAAQWRYPAEVQAFHQKAFAGL